MPSLKPRCLPSSSAMSVKASCKTPPIGLTDLRPTAVDRDDADASPGHLPAVVVRLNQGLDDDLLVGRRDIAPHGLASYCTVEAASPGALDYIDQLAFYEGLRDVVVAAGRGKFLRGPPSSHLRSRQQLAAYIRPHASGELPGSRP